MYESPPDLEPTQDDDNLNVFCRYYYIGGFKMLPRLVNSLDITVFQEARRKLF